MILGEEFTIKFVDDFCNVERVWVTPRRRAFRDMTTVQDSLTRQQFSMINQTYKNCTDHFCEDTRQNALAALTNLGHVTLFLLLGPPHHLTI